MEDFIRILSIKENRTITVFNIIYVFILLPHVTDIGTGAILLYEMHLNYINYWSDPLLIVP